MLKRQVSTIAGESRVRVTSRGPMTAVNVSRNPDRWHVGVGEVFRGVGKYVKLPFSERAVVFGMYDFTRSKEMDDDSTATVSAKEVDLPSHTFSLRYQLLPNK